MPKFRFSFERTYTITEGFERIIDAPSEAEANAAAEIVASQSNMDCPDDCSEIESGHTETGDYEALPVHAKPVKDHEPADYVVGPDGQLHPTNDDGCQTCREAIETRLLPCDECGTLDHDDAEA